VLFLREKALGFCGLLYTHWRIVLFHDKSCMAEGKNGKALSLKEAKKTAIGQA
jgi:hypothetical protein